jgi:hypothetical protein
MPMCKWSKWPEQGQQGRLDMKKWIVILSMACAAPTLAAPPPPVTQPLPGARQATPELAPRQIIERATARAGGETWRRPRTLYLEGYGIFYGPQGAPLINQRHRMWRIYPDFKPNAHNADGKVRIVSERDGKVVSFSAFDGARTNGRRTLALASSATPLMKVISLIASLMIWWTASLSTASRSPTLQVPRPFLA